MERLLCDSFASAQALAKCCASRFEVEVRIERANDVFAVFFPGKLHIKDIFKFTQNSYFFGVISDASLLTLMRYVEKSPFSSQALAWRDTTSGLAWDVARICYGAVQSDFPACGEEIMNALQYAGLSQWRLPTIDELKTLEINGPMSGVVGNIRNWGPRFWSCDESLYGGPEKAFFDIESRMIGHQRYIEQRRNMSTPGDRYTEWAQTVMVCSINVDVT